MPSRTRTARPRVAALLTLLVPMVMEAASEEPITAPPLTVARAVAIALASDDPRVARLQAAANALEETAIAEAQLPDPTVTTALTNVPTDNFAFDQADMTQLRFGIRQEFPPGRSRAVRARQQRSEARATEARRRLELRNISLATRAAWFELAFQQRAIAIVRESQKSAVSQIDALAARFATGRGNAQAITRAELELALLNDRLAEHRRLADAARAALGRYVGAAARGPLHEPWPTLIAPEDLSRLRSALVDHPAVAVETAQIEMADAGVELAQQAYRPRLALEGGYGVREDRPDFATIGVSVSLPLFTEKRQDRRYAAAVQLRGAEQRDRDAVLLDLARDLEQSWSDWERYGQRVGLYRRAVAEHARRTAEASMATYGSGQTDFSELIRSQLAELEIALKQAELESRAGQAWARLMYLSGESS